MIGNTGFSSTSSTLGEEESAALFLLVGDTSWDLLTQHKGGGQHKKERSISNTKKSEEGFGGDEAEARGG